MSDGPVLDVFADHGPGVGTGHLGRCLALAQAWVAAHGLVRLVDEPPLPRDWRGRFLDAGAELITAEESDAPLVVVDGARSGRDLPRLLRSRGAQVLVLDDHGDRGSVDADWVLDQNLGATEAAHLGVPSGCQLLLGSRYALLRSDVVGARADEPADRSLPPRRLLVASGGDPTAPVAAFFDEIVAHPLVAGLGLEVVPLRGVTDVGAVLRTVDLAVSAAGSTTWELCLHGVPSVLVAVVDDQVPVSARVGAAGAGVDAGPMGATTPAAVAAAVAALAADPLRRGAVATAGRALIDGAGARRVAAVLRSGTMVVRRATPDDAHLLWTWANDPGTRDASFDPTPIPWEDHRRWFAAKVGDPAAGLWIATDHDEVPVGSFRVDLLDDAVGEIGVVVAPEHRGKGWAAPMIVAASLRAFDEIDPGRLTTLLARVRPGNVASQRAFEAADFDRGPDGSGNGRTWSSYTRVRHG